MKKLFTLVFIISLLAFISKQSQAQYQAERIINFSSFIRVNTDASLTVNEEITVYANGTQIKRGIFRALPIKNNAHYKILEISKNGVTEPYHTETAGGYINIYCGEEDVFLTPGEYTYSISYQIPRQVRFFKDFDEIYWNVTGTEWDFMIEKADVTVKMPYPVKVINHSGYTGYTGEKGTDFIYEENSNGEIVYKTSRMLAPNEGLTISFSFPKGVIKEPTASENMWYYVMTNKGTFFALLLLVLTLIYYIFGWFKVGRDPQKGAIAVMYFPPEDLAPEDLRFISKMGFDNKAFAAAIVQMAVKKYLIIQNDAGTYTLNRISMDTSQLSAGEKEIANSLFASGESIVLKNTNHTTISSSISSLRRSLKSSFEKIYFFSNSKWLIPGILTTVIAIISIIVSMASNMEVLGPTIFMIMFGGGSMAFLYAVIKSWTKAKEGGKNLAAAIIVTIVFVPFFLGLLLVTFVFGTQANYLPIAVMIIFVAMDILFHYLLKAPTIKGRQLMDKIDGFKEYLGTAEKDELNLHNPPDKTPELFERYLPYAIALGVENHWGTRFNSILQQAMADNSYHPGWYTGASYTAASFATGLGSSFSSAVSSSSTAPSSSGSGGGGFSGGGGGGGGGGGW
jgi:uncharacterized membrane protein YgcG